MESDGRAQSFLATERWAIVLAGGEGQRLRPLLRGLGVSDAPKQFCRLIGSETLLEQTWRRVSLGVPASRTLTVLCRSHEQHFAPFVAGLSPSNVAIQPDNRGTAPALLYGLLRIARLDPSAVVALFPSDHYVEDEVRFMARVEQAYEAVARNRELAVLLGMKPTEFQEGYGWIEPGHPAGDPELEIFKVRRFWEKPERELARTLFQCGSLWNTFVIVAPLLTLMTLIMKALPELYTAFARLAPRMGTWREAHSLDALYSRLASYDFSHQVLVRHPEMLAVMPLSNVGWCDLGEPNRLFEVAGRLAVAPHWVGRTAAAASPTKQ